ncbi:IclR family transcriptional regulator [Paracoccus sp. (in: a-proteobacteria)]|uniref:IclR family transcriptional regulator n=1 Tax=Paracoccus sp. TaxID=267 RepID=UPI00322072E5
MPAASDHDSIPSGLRNLCILEALAAGGRPMTATEINAALNLPVPTIHRLVGTLESEGFLSRQIDGRSYLPGPRLRQLARGAMLGGYYSQPRHDTLIRLNAQVGETCNLSIPDGDAMLYIDRVETQWPLRIQLQVGSRVPLHATASGKMCLAMLPEALRERILRRAPLEAHSAQTITDPGRLRAALDEIRRQGHATDNEELMAGMIALAVPVLDAEGRLAATVSFHAPVQRLTLEQGMRHLPALQAAASELAQDL